MCILSPHPVPASPHDHPPRRLKDVRAHHVGVAGGAGLCGECHRTVTHTPEATPLSMAAIARRLPQRRRIGLTRHCEERDGRASRGRVNPLRIASPHRAESKTRLKTAPKPLRIRRPGLGCAFDDLALATAVPRLHLQQILAARASSRGEPKVCSPGGIESRPLGPASCRLALHASDDGRVAFWAFATRAGGPIDMQRVALDRAVSADHDFVGVACRLGLTADDSDDGTDPGRSRRSRGPRLALGPLRPRRSRSAGVALGSQRPCRSRRPLRPCRPRGADFALGPLRSRWPLRSCRSRRAHFALGALRPRWPRGPLRSCRSLGSL